MRGLKDFAYRNGTDQFGTPGGRNLSTKQTHTHTHTRERERVRENERDTV